MPESVFYDKRSGASFKLGIFHRVKKSAAYRHLVLKGVRHLKFKLSNARELTTVLNLYSFNFKVGQVSQDVPRQNKIKELIKKGGAIVDYQNL